jgi:hypothetical protein
MHGGQKRAAIIPRAAIGHEELNRLVRAAVGAVLRVEVVEKTARHGGPDAAQTRPGRVVVFTRRDEDELRERQVDAEVAVADLVTGAVVPNAYRNAGSSAVTS